MKRQLKSILYFCLYSPRQALLEHSWLLLPDIEKVK
jgi:hypothetical protein